jgi:transposase
MSFAQSPRVLDAAEVAALDAQHVARMLVAKDTAIDQLEQRVQTLQHQIEWFKRQLFGSKSERFAPLPDPQQMHLGQVLGQDLPVPSGDSAGEQQVPSHTRRKPRSDFADDSASAPFFDDSKVPVLTIEVSSPETKDLSPDQYEVVGEKTSHRLAQRPGSYVVLKYVRPVIKRNDTQTLHCPPAPAGVIEGSRADVSFVAGLLIDKFLWHLPLYRQHQRLVAAGFKFSRPWLTQLVQQGAQLLKAIYEAQLASICASRVKAMDEVPIKAGRAGPGKMNAAYFWPIYGEHDEVCFPFFDSRRHENVENALGLKQPAGSVLLSDGYEAYASYAKKVGVTNAQCWAQNPERRFMQGSVGERQAARGGSRFRSPHKI